MCSSDLPEELERENAARERNAWADVLRRHGWLAGDADPATDEGLDQFTVALHRAVAASPARLVGVALTDVVGDRRAQNQPGTDQEYPNWRVPLGDQTGQAITLEQVMQGNPLLDSIVDAVR